MKTSNRITTPSSTEPSLTPSIPSPFAPKARTRVGHTARLPKELRHLVNRMLDDGKPYKEILAQLDKHRDQWPSDIQSLTHKHLVRWRQGGYQDWLFHQQQLAQLRTREEYGLEFVNQSDPDQIHQAALRLAVLRLIESLHQADLSALSKVAFEKPASYAALLSGINRLCRSTLAFCHYNDGAAERTLSRMTADYRLALARQPRSDVRPAADEKAP